MVSLTLCCFEVYSTRQFVLCLTVCHFVLVFFFSVLLAFRLPRLEKREIILVLFLRLFDLCWFDLSVSSSSWCLRRAAVCDCDIPWSFLNFFNGRLLWLLFTFYSYSVLCHKVLDFYTLGNTVFYKFMQSFNNIDSRPDCICHLFYNPLTCNLICIPAWLILVLKRSLWH